MQLSPLWAMLGGALVVLHFLTGWSHHLQSRYETPPKTVPEDRLDRYLHGLKICYYFGAFSAVLLPLVPAGLSVAELVLGPAAPNDDLDRPASVDWLQPALVLGISLGYVVGNALAYLYVASNVFAGRPERTV